MIASLDSLIGARWGFCLLAFFLNLAICSSASAAVTWPDDWIPTWSENDPEIQILSGPTLDEFTEGKPTKGYSLLPDFGVPDILVIISAARVHCGKGSVSPVVLNAVRMEHAKIQKIHYESVSFIMSMTADVFLKTMTDFQRNNLCDMGKRLSSDLLEVSKQQIMREVWRQENGKAGIYTKGADFGVK